MTDTIDQQQEFFKEIENKIIVSATNKIGREITETFTKQGYSTEGILELMDKGYGEYLVNNLRNFVCFEGGRRKGGIDGIKILDALIHHKFGYQVTQYMNLSDNVALEQRKGLFDSLIKSEQGKVFLENIGYLYPDEQQSVVDMLLATQAEWGDFEEDGEREEHYEPGQSPLILEFFEMFPKIDKAKILLHLLKKGQFKAFAYSKEISHQLPSICFGAIVVNLIQDFRIGWLDKYRPLFEGELDEDDCKDIIACLIAENNTEYDVYVYKNIEKFWVSYEQVTQMIKERDKKSNN